jgi:hypothetical protein
LHEFEVQTELVVLDELAAFDEADELVESLPTTLLQLGIAATPGGAGIDLGSEVAGVGAGADAAAL